MPSSFKIYQGTNTSDATAIAGDIISAKTAYGSAGTKLTGTLVLTGDAVVGNVLSGKKFYKDDPTSQLTGTMTDNGAQSITPAAAGNTITAGYHNGSGGVVADADFTAANIKSGVVIWGVTGTAEGAPSLETATSVVDGTATVYYQKFGKLYVIRGVYVASAAKILVVNDQSSSDSRIATLLGITVSTKISTNHNNTNGYLNGYYNGSSWTFTTTNSPTPVLLALLAA